MSAVGGQPKKTRNSQLKRYTIGISEYRFRVAMDIQYNLSISTKAAQFSVQH